MQGNYLDKHFTMYLNLTIYFRHNINTLHIVNRDIFKMYAVKLFECNDKHVPYLNIGTTRHSTAYYGKTTRAACMF